MSKTLQLAKEYEALMHAVQTGVALDHGRGSDDGSPKHLRVGVNSAMVSNAAVVNLMIAKGLFTEEEFFEQLVVEAKREVDRYQEIAGPEITLV